MVAATSTASRREQILRATVRLLGDAGPAGLTHRAVAAEAGVPLAATTYYFASKDELLREALALLASEEVARLEAVRAALGTGRLPARDVAQGIAHVLAQQVGPSRAMAKFETYLEGSRRDELRAAAQQTIEAFVALAEGLYGPEVAPVIVASVDGLLMHELVAEGGEIDEKRLAQRVELVLTRIADG